MIGIFETGDRVRFNLVMFSKQKVGKWSATLHIPFGHLYVADMDIKCFSLDPVVAINRHSDTRTMDEIVFSGREQSALPRGGKVLATMIATCMSPYEGQWVRMMINNAWVATQAGAALTVLDSERFSRGQVQILEKGSAPMTAWVQMEAAMP